MRSPVISRAFSRRQFLIEAAGAAAVLPVSACAAATGRPAGVNLAECGGVGDGRTDNGAALARGLAMAAEQRLPLIVPAGIFVVSDSYIHDGGRPFAVAAQGVIRGEGPQSVLRFRRAQFPAFYGLTIARDQITIQDLAIEVENGGGNWTAAAAITENIRDLSFLRVAFRGIGRRPGHYGVLPLHADVSGLHFVNCHFEKLDFGFVKQTSDTSTQTGIVAQDCTAQDCTEVFEFNSPGLFRGMVTAGSATVSAISDGYGNPFDAHSLAVGQEISCILFPPGTKVEAINDAARITLSAEAHGSSAPNDTARFSAGGCRDGEIRNLRVRDIGQWAVGFAHCERWHCEVYGEEIGYELVHVEDGSRQIEIVAGGHRCNLRRGVVGSPGADNGMVHVSTGSRDIGVRFVVADLTRNAGGSPNALCVQPGGIMGTTGHEIAPRGITVSGRVLMSAGTKAVVAYDSDLRFADLELDNSSTSPADPMMRLSGCTWSGSIAVRNPRRIVEPDAHARGHFDSVRQMTE